MKTPFKLHARKFLECWNTKGIKKGILCGYRTQYVSKLSPDTLIWLKGNHLKGKNKDILLIYVSMVLSKTIHDEQKL